MHNENINEKYVIQKSRNKDLWEFGRIFFFSDKNIEVIFFIGFKLNIEGLRLGSLGEDRVSWMDMGNRVT